MERMEGGGGAAIAFPAALISSLIQRSKQGIELAT